MPHFIATYRYADGSSARRDEVRAEHRGYLASLDGLLLSGPTKDAGGDGASLVLEAASEQEVGALLDADPFVTAGVVAQRSVAAWSIVLGRARAAVVPDAG